MANMFSFRWVGGIFLKLFFLPEDCALFGLI